LDADVDQKSLLSFFKMENFLKSVLHDIGNRLVEKTIQEAGGVGTDFGVLSLSS